MSETSASLSSSEENIVISSSSFSSSERVPTSGSEVRTSNPQPPQPSTSQPPQPSTSQPSHSLPAKNALGDVKDQAEDKANPKPWYTADEKSNKMSTEELLELIRQYPLPDGWYARVPGLQEPANYGTKFEMGIYEEQVKSGYRLPLHPFSLRFFKHYHMAPGQLVPNGWRKLFGLIYLVETSGYKPDPTDFMRDFENPGKPTPNNLTKHILSHIKLRGGLSTDEPLSEKQLEWAKIIPHKPILAGLTIPHPPAIPSMSSAETVPLEMAIGSGKSPQGGFLGMLQKAKGKIKEKQPSVSCPLFQRRQGLLLLTCLHGLLKEFLSTRIQSFDLDGHLGVMTLGCQIARSQSSIFFMEFFNKEMYANESAMLSRFKMARQVAAKEAQQKRDAIKEADEATCRVEELSKREADYIAHIETLQRRLEWAKRKIAKETKKVEEARDKGIRDFLDGNTREEWLKKRTNDGLEIYEMGFTKAKEMFAERFPDIPLDDFVMPAVVSPSGETAMPSAAGDAAASHPSEEGPSGDAPEP
ncbi:hypothetical protein RJ639_036872 [Escallonia herrerae]|uniref:Transposase (putative) gypsy type domain-containing protein n=1 Tax=Escallonia herrerae TaxID=1293975 RepID=A0AA89BBJ1_9ASTE|nr:hypothetical protein RJ639_036872 [Escallonia herrerae]